MARRRRSAQLETRTARLKLRVRKKPHDFTTIAPGIALAYRRNQGAGLGTRQCERRTPVHRHRHRSQGARWTPRQCRADSLPPATHARQQDRVAIDLA